jgi:hypothetical protein
MHFGKAIVMSFILFAVFIGTLVFVSVREDINLVSKEYYQEELAYQKKLDKMNNAGELNEQPAITAEKGKVSIAFGIMDRIEKGELKMFRPSDSKLDQKFDILPAAGNTRVFALSRWEPGLYRASITFTMGGKDYHFEKLIVF